MREFPTAERVKPCRKIIFRQTLPTKILPAIVLLRCRMIFAVSTTRETNIVLLKNLFPSCRELLGNGLFIYKRIEVLILITNIREALMIEEETGMFGNYVTICYGSKTKITFNNGETEILIFENFIKGNVSTYPKLVFRDKDGNKKSYYQSEIRWLEECDGNL